LAEGRPRRGPLRRAILPLPRYPLRGAAIISALIFGYAVSAPAWAVAQAPAASAQQTKARQTKGETPAVVLNDDNVASIMGQNVFSASGQSMGRIVDILVDRDGNVRAAIIDFGGFLGVGSRKVAVDWHALHFPAKGKLDHLILSLSRDEVRVAPEYKPGEPVVVVKATGNAAPPAASGPSTPSAKAKETPAK